MTHNSTDSKKRAQEAFRQSCQETRSREDSFGGYLRSIRRMRKLRVEEMARSAGVDESLWDLWEANSRTPSQAHLTSLVERLEFSPYKHERLAYFLDRVPRSVLGDLCRARLTGLAAQGKALVDPRLEWEALHQTARARLRSWGKERDIEFPRDLLSVVAGIRSEEQIEDWLEEVFGDDEAF